MLESNIEVRQALSRCQATLDDWGLSAAERRAVITGGISKKEPGAAAALEKRQRHIVDVDRAVAELMGHTSLVRLWLRLPQDAFAGLTPLELVMSHVAGLQQLRRLLVRERLERGSY